MTTEPTTIETVALLNEPVRRALYEWVTSEARPVSRDEAAAAVGVSRALAAFHLDRLAASGLLAPEFKRLSGRTGPGAGRPSKLYRRGPREVTVSIPDRRYEVAARVFAESIERTADRGLPASIGAVAHELGQSIGVRARRLAGARLGRARLRAGLLGVLRDAGYAPRETAEGEIRLANCPFDGLVADHRELVCGMNLAMADGMLAGLGDERISARLDPQPGQCCVAIASSGPKG